MSFIDDHKSIKYIAIYIFNTYFTPIFESRQTTRKNSINFNIVLC